MVTITVLNDNTPGRGMLSEHGLSFHIQTDDRKVLLDAGPGEVFKKNSEKLGLDLFDLDAVVLSHGHWDHGNGLRYLPSLPLYAHPAVFKKRYHRERNEDYIGLDFNRADLEERFDLHITDKPFQMGRNIWYLGEIARLNNFEAKSTAYIDDDGNEDFVPDDSGVAVKTKDGLIVISGCAHAGIVNTINHAKKVTGIENVRAVLGGFHLKNANELTRQTIREIKQMNIKDVYPSHCTDLPALAMFFNTFGMNQIRTGDVLTFE